MPDNLFKTLFLHYPKQLYTSKTPQLQHLFDEMSNLCPLSTPKKALYFEVMLILVTCNSKAVTLCSQGQKLSCDPDRHCRASVCSHTVNLVLLLPYTHLKKLVYNL